MTGIGLDGVAAGNKVGATFDAVPQLAAKPESSSGAEDWQGAGGCCSVGYRREYEAR